MKKFQYIFYSLLSVLSMSSCIENDIPYPIVEANILSMKVEGQRSAPGSQQTDAAINKKDRTVSIYVDDRVDLSKLKVTNLTTTENATIKVASKPDFPETGFENLSGIVDSTKTVIDFTQPVPFVLSIYQDYEWTISVQQVIERAIEVSGQVGDAIIDLTTNKVVIYVDENQALNNIEVSSMDLGGVSGTVEPDPTTITDFTFPVTFNVKNYWSDEWESWTVYVHPNMNKPTAKLSIFPMVTKAILEGQIQKGQAVTIEYKKAKDKKWTTLSDLNVDGSSLKAEITDLKPNTDYECRMNTGGTEGETITFTTGVAIPLENGDFENWHLEKNKIWNPWKADAESFWDTGNDGAAVVGKSNSIPTSDDTATGHGKAAFLETKDMFGYLAAGNIFTGEYVRTEIPNGVLNFGRKFDSFPTKLRINYKYKSATITHGKEPFEALKGAADSCHIFIALTNWDKPLEIRTNPKDRQLFDKNAKEVIAYAEYVQGTTNTNWETKDLVLNYRRWEKPTYMLIVATASKYGDYFTGAPGSTLVVDNFELLYD